MAQEFVARNGIISKNDTLVQGGLTANTISATTYYNLPSFSGGTVTGPTNFTGNLSATTISATTYYNLPLSATTNTFVTANTFNNATYDLTLTRNDGTSLTSNLGLLSTDVKVSGGTYNINTGVVTFTNTTGGTFQVTGFSSGMTDTFVTGGTYAAGTATFTRSNNASFNVTGFNTGTVTAVNTGNGMNFTNFSTTGTITMGTPSSTTLASTNALTSNSHTHAFAPGGTVSQYITGAGTLVTFPTITNGTVTSVAALTLGTTGTDLSSTVANSTTTPVITLNIPTASATNRGALSNIDWTTFNAKQTALNGTGFIKIVGTTISYDNSTYYLASNPSSYTSNLGTVTAVNTGNGMNFTNFSTTGTITMGTPSSTTLASTNSLTTNSHTHAFAPGGTVSQYITGAGTLVTFPTITNGTVTGSGTDNYIPRFNGTSAIENSIIYDNGSVGIGTTTPGYTLDINGNIGSTRYYQKANGVPTSNLGNPTVTEMALFDTQFNNKTEFLDPAYLKFYTSTDGTTWTEYTSFSDSVKREFVGGDNSSGVNIPNLTPYFAVEITAVSYVFLNALYMYWSSNSHSTTVKTQKRRVDNATWYDHTTSTTAVSAWPGHLYMPFDTVPFYPAPSTSTGHYDKIRFIFQPTWASGAYASSAINLYNFQVWGGYPAGKRNVYSTDSLKNITFPANVTTNATLVATSVAIGTTSLNGNKLNIVGGPTNLDQLKYTRAIEVSSTDLNNLIIAGFYDGSNLTNSPTSGWFYITVEKHSSASSSDWVHQTATSLGSGNVGNIVYTRTKTSGTWTAWKTLTTSSDISGTLNKVAKFTGANSLGDSLIYDNGTNVGIGTTTPQTLLEVRSSGIGNAGAVLTLNRVGQWATAYCGLKLNTDDAGTDSWNVGLLATGNNTFNIGKNGSAHVSILDNGNVGIGTTNPFFKLDINGGTSGVAFRVLSTNATSLRTFFEATAGNVEQHFLYSGNQDWVLGLDKADSNKFKLASADDTFASAKLTVTTGGNVGIGTTTPQSILDVVTPGNGYASFATSLSVGQYSGIHFGFRENNTNYRKSAIVFERTDLSEQNAQGKVHILNGPQSGGGSATLSDAKLTIAENGNVGIGTTSPAYRLYVSDSGNTSGIIAELFGGTNYGAALSYSRGGNYSWTTGIGPAGGVPTSFFTISQGGTTPRLVIAHTSGNVGIGTTSPNSKLQISSINSEYLPSTSSFSLRKNEEGYGLFAGVSGSGNGWLQAGTSNDATNYNLILQSRGGNVGVGTTAPLATLHVSGNALISGNLTATTISATTYYNLPLSATTNTFITANTFNNATYDLTLTRNDGTSLTSNLGLLSTDIKVTGGTYNINSGVVTFTNSTGGTFNVTGFSSGMTDTFVTGGTYAAGTATFTRSNNASFNVTGFNTGTVTNVSALTLGTTGTDLSSTVANGTTTPVITLNIPTASAVNRGALSSTDWTIFNGKFNLPSLTSGSVLFSNGTTIAQDNANFYWDDTNNRLGIGTTAPNEKLTVLGSDATTFHGGGIYNSYTYGNSDKAESRFNLGKLEGSNFQPMGAIGAFPQINTDSSDGILSFYTRTSQSVTEKMRILANGNVGIGTTSPATKLHIEGTTVSYGQARLINTSTSGEASINIGRSNQTADQRWTVGQGTSGIVDSFGFYTGGSNRMVITTAGNVGIGTSSPTNPLTIHKWSTGGNFSNANQLKIQSDNWGGGAGYGLEIGYYHDWPTVYGSRIQSKTNNIGDSLLLNPDGGNVGIGTTTPSFKLSVSGSSSSDGIQVIQAGLSRVELKGDGTARWGSSADFGRLTWDAGKAILQGQSGKALSLGANNLSDHLYINTSGNVGVGTTSPANKLSVASNATYNNENTYSIAATSSTDIAYKTIIGYDYSNDIGVIAAVRTAVGWRNLSIPQGSLGIGNIGPTEKLHVTGNIRVTGSYYDSNNLQGTSGQVLSSTGTGTDWVSLSEITGVDGTGTANYVSKWLDGNTITNSLVYDNGTNVGIGTTSPQVKLEVRSLENNTVSPVNSVAKFVGNDHGIFIGALAGTPNYGAWLQSMRESDGLVFPLLLNPNGGNVGIGTTNPAEKLEVVGDVKTTNALLSNQQNTSVGVGTSTVFTKAVGSYTAAFFDYVVTSGANARAGTVFMVINGSSVEFAETETNSIGSTTALTLVPSLSGGNILLRATSTSGTWSVKVLARVL